MDILNPISNNLIKDKEFHWNTKLISNIYLFYWQLWQIYLDYKLLNIINWYSNILNIVQCALFCFWPDG